MNSEYLVIISFFFRHIFLLCVIAINALAGIVPAGINITRFGGNDRLIVPAVYMKGERF